jgi:TorA maturation chaperone TorD/DNA-binding transcriptional regulator YdaS (Cro superfamily)
MWPGRLRIKAGTMRDAGLQRAIDAAGSIGALARAVGIAQPSVSGWARVPSDRLAVVETATGVARNVLRPDLYPAPGDVKSGEQGGLDDVDLARARGYRLLAHLIAKPPTRVLLDKVASITGDASPLGMAWIALADAARQTSEAAAGEEYFKLLVGVGRGEVLPYASFYLAGFLHERPLAAIRADLARLSIERRTGIHEPEDNVATLFDALAGMIDGTYAASQADQDAFFDAHIRTWVPRLFADIAVAPSANFYRAVADVGSQWIDLETRAFAIAA